jgi:hypothetical protein
MLADAAAAMPGKGERGGDTSTTTSQGGGGASQGVGGTRSGVEQALARRERGPQLGRPPAPKPLSPTGRFR